MERRIQNRQRRWQLLLAIAIATMVFIAFTSAHADPATDPLRVNLTIEQPSTSALQLEGQRFRIEPFSPYFSEFKRYRAFDFQALETLAAHDEPSRLFELFPSNPTYRSRITTVNLYRRDMPLAEQLRIDLRVAGKLSLEARTKILDAMVIVYPLQARLSLAVGHEWDNGISLYTFLDPFRNELLGILAKKLSRNADLSLMSYYRLSDGATINRLNLRFQF